MSEVAFRNFSDLVKSGYLEAYEGALAASQPNKVIVQRRRPAQAAPMCMPSGDPPRPVRAVSELPDRELRQVAKAFASHFEPHGVFVLSARFGVRMTDLANVFLAAGRDGKYSPSITPSANTVLRYLRDLAE